MTTVKSLVFCHRTVSVLPALIAQRDFRPMKMMTPGIKRQVEDRIDIRCQE